MNKLLIGLLAGAIATVPMTATMFAIRKFIPKSESDPLPPHEITTHLAEAVGPQKHINTPGHRALTWASHFGYGACVGALYLPLADSVSAPSAVTGMAYGLGVWTASYMGLLPALDLHTAATKEPVRRNSMMIAAHLVWGIALGMLTDQWESANKR